MVGHEDEGINSVFLALERVNRTQDIILDLISWQSVVPFSKYLHQFSLPSGEDIILSQDFLGMALKINESSLDLEDYQYGYANVPSDFLEFLIPDNQNVTYDSSVKTSIMVQDSSNELQIDLTFSNITFLFQNNSIALDDFIESAVNLSDHLMIVQFEKIIFTIIIRKYDHYGTSGVETLSEITIGNVMNLIINEELPPDQTWINAFEYEIQDNFRDFIPIHETFSWYHGSNIRDRLKLFPEISFSLITAQNIGVLNGTQPVNNLQIVVDGQNKTIIGLSESTFPVKEEISAIYKQQKLFSALVKGRNFAIQKEDSTEKISLIPVETQVISLNQRNKFANNPLFLQETFLLNEMVVESVKRFISDPNVSIMGTNELVEKSRLDLISARYSQEFQVKEWSGIQFSLHLMQFAVKNASLPTEKTKLSEITSIPIASGILGLLIICMVLKRVKRGRDFFLRN